MQKIRILLFDGIELLDFAGPLEVFTVADHLLSEKSPFDVKTIARKESIAVSKSNLVVTPNLLNESEEIDLLLIPGGIGTRTIINSNEELEYIRNLTTHSKVCASVCTGALVLGKMGMLDGLEATTHKLGVPLLKEISPKCSIDRSKRFIDQGCIITSAGISAGIDMSLYLLEKHHGLSLKNEVQNYMEYMPENF